jgi:hypothetical protein
MMRDADSKIRTTRKVPDPGECGRHLEQQLMPECIIVTLCCDLGSGHDDDCFDSTFMRNFPRSA